MVGCWSPWNLSKVALMSFSGWKRSLRAANCDILKAKLVVVVVSQGLQHRLDLQDGQEAEPKGVPPGLGLLEELGCQNCYEIRKVLSFDILKKSRLIP